MMTPDQIAADIDAPLRKLPAHLREGLRAYLVNRQPTGAFLRAVLVNDLSGTIDHADPVSFQALRKIVSFIYFYAPARSHGSYEAVTAWLAEDAA